MSDEKEYIQTLKNVLGDMIAERRVSAASYPEEITLEGVVKKLTTQQNDIEIVMRALEHEEKLSPKGGGFF